MEYWGFLANYWLVVAVVIAGCLVIGYCSERESADGGDFSYSGVALLVIIFELSIYYYDGPKSLLTLLKANLPFFLGALGCYLALGVGWSFAKWYFYVNRVVDRIRAVKDEFLEAVAKGKHAGLKSTDPQEKLLSSREFFADINSAFCHKWDTDQLKRAGVSILVPAAMENKSRITMWVAYWPVSAVWTILNDPLRRLVDFIFNRVRGVYSVIGERATKKLDREFGTSGK